MSEEKTLHLAITMAGAVSAGAYTAGVMDYLFEVLDKWSKMKNDPEFQDKVPNHNIKIEVLSGASAGGMTAAIASVVLQQEDKKSVEVFNGSEIDKKRLKENRFYDSWVNLTKENMMDELLDENDAVTLDDETTSCISAFNSNFISKVAESAMPEKSEGMTLKNSDFAAEKLRLFVTLTNLSGFSRIAQLSGGAPGASRFVMQDHRDLVLFRFNPRDDDEESDGSIEVNFTTGRNVRTLRNSAIATGAFPFGLAYKSFTRNQRHISDNVLLKHLYDQVIEVPEEYRATFIDGGLINNEPFELTEMLLKRQSGGGTSSSKAKSKAEEFNSTILMIDPFPTDSPIKIESEEANFPYSFVKSIGKLISTVRTQVLVKTDLIKDAFEQDNYTCFIISPRRREYADEVRYFNGSKGIACGTLGGFGGFYDKDFREHDFFLGRINCKSFLQNHFKVPVDTQNPIFKDAYLGEAKTNFLIRDEANQKYLPIIPDVNKLTDADVEIDALYRNLQFPSMSQKQFENSFETLKPKILRRLTYFIETNFIERKTRFYLKIALFFLKKKLLEETRNVIKTDLKDWKILKNPKKD